MLRFTTAEDRVGSPAMVPVAVRRPALRLRARALVTEGRLETIALIALMALSAYARTREIKVWFWIDEALSVGISSHPLTDIPHVLRMDGSPLASAAAVEKGEIAEICFGGACFMFRNDLGVRFDERYIHDSILLPKKEIAAGYEPIMPSFAGQVSEEQILEIVAYLKSLKPEDRIEP